MANIKSASTAGVSLGYGLASSGNAHHHIRNALFDVARNRRAHNCAEAVVHSYWRALTPEWQRLVTRKAMDDTQRGLAIIAGFFTSTDLIHTLALQRVDNDGPYAVPSTTLDEVATAWTSEMASKQA